MGPGWNPEDRFSHNEARLISALVVHYNISKVSSVCLVSIAEQVGVCLTLSNTLNTGFHVMTL